uniref:Leucine zipper transcription factor-like protein 1 n=1 Tax=Mantoniella antarctica TaxID=81844 RepID=A0A6U3KD44_9CHLO|mmetsp:Transcript_7979/g.19770  ORF Transcript_7979/g.19770 Transcript_7979/m.19770 type:complete len:270 (+) Transcript_7979:260-1069(+)
MAKCLSEESELQVQSYLRFAKTKREENAREVDLTFDDVRHYKLQDAVYTQGEVSAMVDEVNLEVKSTLEKELVNNTYVTGAMLKMLFEQAEEAGCVLTIDTNKLEDMKLLEDVKATEKVALSRPAADFARGATQGQKLGKIPAGLPPMDLQIKGGNERLEREIADLRDKYVKLQGQRQSGIMDKVGFQSSFKMAPSSSDDVNVLKAELVAARKEGLERLQQSAQFQQMKKMMVQKTKELQAARQMLKKYEPENDSDVRSADVEDDEFNI